MKNKWKLYNYDDRRKQVSDVYRWYFFATDCKIVCIFCVTNLKHLKYLTYQHKAHSHTFNPRWTHSSVVTPKTSGNLTITDTSFTEILHGKDKSHASISIKATHPLQKKGLVLCYQVKNDIAHPIRKNYITDHCQCVYGCCQWASMILVRYQYLTHFSGQTWSGWPWSCRWSRWDIPSPQPALSWSVSWGSANIILFIRCHIRHTWGHISNI